MPGVSVKYRDFWFKIIGSLLISAIIDALNREESFFQRLSTRYFYTDLLGGFIIALVLWQMASFAIRYLDKKYHWQEQPVRRLLWQLVLGVIVPSALSFVFTAAFMKLAYNQDIFETSWLYNEFYTVILFILFINLVYFAWWLYLTRQNPGPTVIPVAANENNGLVKKDTIEVTKAGKTILLPYNEVAYAYINEGYCYIKPLQGDGFVTTYTLDEVSRMADENQFFRINRQVLISRRSCVAYKSIENGKIELDLHPPFKTPVVVSQKRARDFRKWVSFIAEA